MGSYADCLHTEEAGYRLIKPYLEKTFDEYVFVNSKRRSTLLKLFQTNFGDLIVRKGDDLYFIDLKTERENKYHNFFLETWSNKSRNKAGWFVPEVGINADFIFYVFLNEKCFYIIDLAKARKWAYADNQLERYPERKQSKHNQLNDTWGRCVKIKDLTAALKCKRIQL